jgi:hypothetical protein
MPYSRGGPNDYVSPKGTHINAAQNKLWHTLGGKWPGQKKSEGKMNYAKGGDVHNTSYAKGGPVLGRTTNFMKIKDEFRDPDEKNASADADQKYGKSGEGAGKGFTKPPKNTPKVLKRGK